MTNPYDTYHRTLGNTPPAIQSLFAMNEELANLQTGIRSLAYAERHDGLELHIKELMYVFVDLLIGNIDGAINHLEAGRRAGLTSAQLQECFIIAFQVVGISAWGLGGYRIWDAWVAGEARP